MSAAQGLGFAAQTGDLDANDSSQQITPLFAGMVQKDLLDQQLFSLWLNPVVGAEPAGELSVGTINTARFDGPIT